MKTACVWAGVEVAVVVCEVSQALILALIPCLEPLKGTGCLFRRWIWSLIQVACPDLMYLLVMMQAWSQWPSVQQKILGQGPNWKKGVGAMVLMTGATGVRMGVAAGMLHIGSGSGGGT